MLLAGRRCAWIVVATIGACRSAPPASPHADEGFVNPIVKQRADPMVYGVPVADGPTHTSRLRTQGDSTRPNTKATQ